MGPGSRFALLFLALMLYSMGGDGHPGISRKKYCQSVRMSVYLLNHRFSTAVHHYQNAIEVLSIAKKKCAEIISENGKPKEVLQENIRRSNFLENHHTAVTEIERQIMTEEKKLQSILETIGRTCNAWVQTMPLTPSLRKDIRQQLAEAEIITKDVEKLGQTSTKHASTTTNWTAPESNLMSS
ncbi:Putative cell surface-expressed gene family, partial [Trypanosoma congolense IL3000]